VKRLSILVADDHPVVRHGLRALLEANAGWKIVAEASNGREAVAKVRELRPDLAILDISMPLLNGLDAAREIATHTPKTRVLILSMHDAEELIRRAVESGAQGFVRKSEAESELVAAVRAVLNDNLFFPAVAGTALGARAGHPTASLSRLTAREREILQLIAEGNSNKEVAAALGVSPRTIENHRASIMHKLRLKSLSELVRYAVRNKIIAA